MELEDVCLAGSGSWQVLEGRGAQQETALHAKHFQDGQFGP